MRQIDNTKTEIILGGEMGDKYGRSHHLVVDSPVEALRLLMMNYPQFKQDLIDGAAAGVDYQFVVDDSRSIGATELNLPIGGQRLFFAAIVEGEKGVGGILEAVAGVILIAVATVFQQYELYPALTPLLGAAGAGLLLGGITSLLTTIPKATGASNDSLTSFYFNGPVNTQQQGLPVPVVYGRALIGSTAISASMQAVDLVSAPAETGNLT
jgi:predicted phage tail protein